ncbi:MAG: helix-turn-helix transcriptional regulator, partial [Lactococcus raffinolactis]
MNISDRIKSLRIEKGNTQLEIAEKLGIIVESYRKYELGSRIPAKKSLEKLANVFDVSVSYLIGETNIKHIDKINQKIDSLSENRQQKVFDYIDKQYYEQEIESNVVHLRNDLIPYQVIFEQSLSAGYGNGYTDEQETYTVYWDKDVRYDYAAEIEGNSMEP